MDSMNLKRVALGGLVAGIILIIADLFFSHFVGGRYIAAHSGVLNETVAAAGSPRAIFVVAMVKDMMNGLAIVWVYAGIRPRFGPRPRTGIYASVLAWFFVLPFIGVASAFRVLSVGLACIVSLEYLTQFLIAGYVGGMLYREREAGTT